ncbi:hypothetical protein [Streptomyces pseudogriseolus]|uniref:hypothetical protein n=1 Tax=Streptomyces pseudogriseolus TaxID=36817 RepID=UPI003FA2EE2E
MRANSGSLAFAAGTPGGTSLEMSMPPDPAASPPPGPHTHRAAVRVPGVLRTAAAYA